MSRFDAIIFDWAGTTVDYGSFAPVQAFIKAFEEFGITPTIEEVIPNSSKAFMNACKIGRDTSELQSR